MSSQAVREELDERKSAAEAAEKTVKDAEKALVAAEARVTKVIADGDEAAIALLQAAVEARKTETATLAELNEALSRLAADLGTAAGNPCRFDSRGEGSQADSEPVDEGSRSREGRPAAHRALARVRARGGRRRVRPHATNDRYRGT